MARGGALALRQLLGARRLVRAPGASDALTARLVERAGFPAVYMTGFGATATRLGAPDIGLLTQTEMADHARAMVRATALPVIADADTGYGGAANLLRTVEELAQAGVAAIHLEDQALPKRCGQMAGARLVPMAEHVRRLRGALAARGTSELVVIGRTDALGVEGLEPALDRARAYADAGVDLVFVDGVKTRAQVEAIARGLDAPKVLSLVDGTDAARVTADEAAEMGFAVLLHALTTLFAATRAMAGALQTLARDGTADPAALTGYAEFTEIVGLGRYQDFERDHG